jgi:hypothetical protein
VRVLHLLIKMNFNNCNINSTASETSISPFDTSVNEQEFNNNMNSIFDNIEVDNEVSNGDIFQADVDSKDFKSTTANFNLNYNDFYEQQQQQLLEHHFQYILVAPTSPAIRINEDSLTYLNQGQNYELRILKNDSLKSLSNFETNYSSKKFYNNKSKSSLSTIATTKIESPSSSSSIQENRLSSSSSGVNSGPVYLSIIRLCFWDRKLQEIEQDEIKEVIILKLIEHLNG